MVIRHSFRGSRGFTLAEVLAALLFLAIVIPVALQAMHIASRAGSVSVRKAEAARVAERILNENLVTTNWNNGGNQSGTLNEGLRQFRWTLQNDPWTFDPNLSTMRQLSVQVTYTAQGQDYFVRLSTLVDSLPPTSSTNSAR
ncbi:exported hypothetical protein [Verrucomicrobia bacterium]|nr:exported hypothetical protein [Verrucomicrobiota bacterium]